MSAQAFRAVTLDHVGIALASLDSTLCELLGVPQALKLMPSGAAVGRFGPDMQLEAVTSGRAGSPVDRFLEQRGPGLHHIALRVDEPLADVLARLEGSGFHAAGPVEPSSDGRPSVFLHPKTTGGVLLELVEGPRPS
jgi:catechol 2,3-dioxygenase-like lactoylglutathione lyase family enzyme